MNPIDRATVRKVGMLARLRFTDDEEERFAHDLGRILGHVSELDKLPADAPVLAVAPRTPQLRDDVVTNAPRAEEMLRNAPDRLGFLLRVPAVIEGDE